MSTPVGIPSLGNGGSLACGARTKWANGMRSTGGLLATQNTARGDSCSVCPILTLHPLSHVGPLSGMPHTACLTKADFSATVSEFSQKLWTSSTLRLPEARNSTHPLFPLILFRGQRRNLGYLRILWRKRKKDIDFVVEERRGFSFPCIL